MLHIQPLARYKEKDIYTDRFSLHKVERSDLTNVLNATLINLSPINFVLCLRLEKNKYTFGSVGVFHQQGPCTWSLSCLYEQVHLEQNMVEFYNSQTPPSEGPRSTRTNTLSKILPTPHFELLGKRRTWATPYQEVQTSRSTPKSNDAPKQ